MISMTFKEMMELIGNPIPFYIGEISDNLNTSTDKHLHSPHFCKCAFDGLFDKIFPQTPVNKPLHVGLSDCLPVVGIDFAGAAYDW